MVDVSRLSTAERHVLLMLAQGHTAKSIAGELGTTEGIVNERLREARRKTGVGSSRELARLMSTEPQEIRDKKIGMAAATTDVDTRDRPGRRGWPPLLGVVTMIIVASVVGALTAMAISDRPARPPRVVATYPAANTAVPAGRLAIKITFDQPMRPESYSVIMHDRASFPACLGKPAQSVDGRSFTLDCVVATGRSYALGFNNDRHRNFVSVDGVPASPATLRFSTR
jgi:DNA-binding CsgD family transcriptional regulator